jgi:alkylation response protein AidB-like acyl-CoA dehydrogenase
MTEAGLFQIVVPHSLGGWEAQLHVLSDVCLEVAKADASAAWCVSQNAGICRMAGYLPREGAEEIFGDSRAVLAWGNGPSTAVKVDGGYRLTGRFSFASGIRHATWTGAHDAPLADRDGNPVFDESGKRRTVTLFFRPSEAEITNVWQVSGLRGTGSDSYRVEDLFVPDHRAELPERQEPGPLYLFGTTNVFSTGFASVSLGIARATLDAFIELAATKTPRHVNGLLREQPTAHDHVARTEATWRSAYALLSNTVRDAWERTCAHNELSLESRVDLRLATTYAMQQSAIVVDAAYTASGATAIFEANPFERRFRDMHAATQHLQAREDHFEPVGQYLFGLDPPKLWL